MEREDVLECIRAAEERIARGEKSIDAQRQRIAELRRGGHATDLEEKFLQVLERSQMCHLATRHYFVNELASVDPWAPRQL